MEVGPLSEWVTAVAEIAAVCVALFLPYYSEQKKQRRRNLKYKTVIRSYTKRALEGDKNGVENLKQFLKITFLVATSNDDQTVLSTGLQISNLLETYQVGDKKQEESIKQLIKSLN